MKKIVALIFVFVVFGCQNDSNPKIVEPSPIASYFFSNMHYSQGASLSFTESNLVWITYKNGKVTKRQGGVRAIDPATGFSSEYSSEISDTLIYSDQKVLVEEGRILPYYTQPSSRTEFLLDHQQRMVQRININTPLIYQSPMDTTKYSYDSNGRLHQSTRGKLNLGHEVANFYYNSSQNLDSIVTKNYLYGDILLHTVKETFTEYDAAPNPLKHLFVFKETFLRSLSRNNYMHYKRIKFYDQNIEESEERHWTIPHDDNGEILFDAN